MAEDDDLLVSAALLTCASVATLKNFLAAAMFLINSSSSPSSSSSSSSLKPEGLEELIVVADRYFIAVAIAVQTHTHTHTHTCGVQRLRVPDWGFGFRVYSGLCAQDKRECLQKRSAVSFIYWSTVDHVVKTCSKDMQ